MLTIVSKKSSTKYTGTVSVTDEQVSKIEQTFTSKYAAFVYGIEQGWTKKSIMTHCLGTGRDQYFYNYLTKYQASKS